jgi:UDPglucose 6-dehydrogenase
MKIGIIGNGVVGKHLVKDIQNSKNEVVIYDKYQPEFSSDDCKCEINKCDGVFICVGTPEKETGAPDDSSLYDVMMWLKVPIIMIRSTILPGTTNYLINQFLCNAVFIPEFIGEGVNAPYNNMKQPPFLIIGGEDLAQKKATDVLSHIYNSECEFVYCTSKEAEIAKYAENYFLALKVTWANEMYDICKCYNADYQKTMNVLTHDYRIGKSHTFVFEDKRGFDGRCLPKDTSALLWDVGKEIAPLLAEIKRINAGRKNV